MEKRLFTSESVTEGHPDKMCDAISDAILDACMAEDPMSRVACETASCTGFVLVTGEITTPAAPPVPDSIRAGCIPDSNVRTDRKGLSPRMGCPRCVRCTRIWCMRPVSGMHRTSARGPRRVFHVRSFRKTVVHAFPAGCTACLTHMRLSATSPCLKMGAVHAVSVHSGHSCTIARYSLCIRRRCMALPSSLAALLFLATSVRPLVSLSSLLTRERAAPLAIS